MEFYSGIKKKHAIQSNTDGASDHHVMQSTLVAERLSPMFSVPCGSHNEENKDTK
jgi:hypothetical protein